MPNRKSNDTRPAWQKAIDDEIEDNNRKTAQAANQKEKQKLEEAQRIRHEKLSVLGNTFQCHICGTKSVEPARNYAGEEPIHSHSPYYEDWTLPGDLVKCSRCQQWTCEKETCIYKYICKDCAPKS